MRSLGYEVVFAIAKGAVLAKKAREAGFIVYELPFQKKYAFYTISRLIQLTSKHRVTLINTHSSLDAWFGGIAGKISRKKVVRTRHLSTQIRPGINSRLLYKHLADYVVTTSSGIIPMIIKQSARKEAEVSCVPTGVDPSEVKTTAQKSAEWREKLKVGPEDLLIGTMCVVRSWKGIEDFLHAANRLRDNPRYKWVVIGGGHLKDYFPLALRLKLEDKVVFTGHLDSPYDLLGACDLFLLLSTANEGISQATLQAAYLGKPLITTDVGGLSEVCLEGQTGVLVSPSSPHQVVQAVMKLDDQGLRAQYGAAARKLVEEKFLFSSTLAEMEKVYEKVGR